MDLLESILDGRSFEVSSIIKERLGEIVRLKLEEKRKELANSMFGENFDYDFENEDVEDLEEKFRGIDLGRERVVQYRFRRGKFQARAYRSHAPTKGYRVKTPHQTNTVGRQTPTEMQKRRLQMRYNKWKRKSKIQRILQKRQISINRKKAMGLE